MHPKGCTQKKKSRMWKTLPDYGLRVQGNKNKRAKTADEKLMKLINQLQSINFTQDPDLNKTDVD